jgi:hypothetical protein
VYKNDERLGVMQKSGLTDAAGYRWAVSLYGEGDSARIDAVPVAKSARMIAQEPAMHAALHDTALPAGTRLRVEGLGDGVYERWERKTFGANAHFLDFGDEHGGVQQVALRGLAPSQWSVLPPLVATVRALEVTGGEAVEVEGVSLDWSVSRLNAGVVDGTEVHALAQVAGAAAARRAAAAAGGAVAGGAGVIAEGQPPVAAEQARDRSEHERRGGGGCGWLCCGSPQQ